MGPAPSPSCSVWFAHFEVLTGVRLSLMPQKVEVSDPELADKIIDTNPAPGTDIIESATVILLVGELAP